MSIKHTQVISHIQEESNLTQHYAFMIITSCAIATLGLLQSSPAVVIGAMLISPLMGPIMSLGFSLSILNLEQMKNALKSLIIGIALSIGVSVTITYCSPISDATSEILARTQPNLFDLLIAIFSGLAGGYAVIKHKGETIVGVAIATALMPPLAVVGFGLATAQPEIYKGATILFMTNLLAIAFSATLLAKWYGFGGEHTPKHTVWQMCLIFGVFGALSIPLGVSLKHIAYQTVILKTAKQVITSIFDSDSKISQLNATFIEPNSPLIEALVLTPNYNTLAQEKVSNALNAVLKTPYTLKLDQIIIAKEKIKQAQPLASNEAKNPNPETQMQLARQNQVDAIQNNIKQAALFPLRFIATNPGTHQISVYPKLVIGLSLGTLREFEASMNTTFPEWHIEMIPPAQPLPYIYFMTGTNIPRPGGENVLANIIWTLMRWEIKQVTVVGHAGTKKTQRSNTNLQLASQRATYLAEQLHQAGIDAISRTEHQSAKQKDEVSLGINYFQTGEIRLNQDLVTTPDTALKNNSTEQTPSDINGISQISPN